MTNEPSIPSTLDEAVDAILRDTPPEGLQYLRDNPLNRCLGSWHHGGGTAMRNDWRLWEHDHALARDLTARGFAHADDRSGVIMRAVWHKVNGKAHDIAAEAESNRRHWERAGVLPDGTPIPGAKPETSFNLFVKRDGTVAHEDDTL